MAASRVAFSLPTGMFAARGAALGAEWLRTRMLTRLLPFTAHARTDHKTFAGLRMPRTSRRAFPSSSQKIKNFCREQYGGPCAHVKTYIARFIERA